MKLHNMFLPLLFAISVPLTTYSQSSGVLQDAIRDRSARMEWWREAKFGMFIHWGPVSMTGKEISWSRGGPRPGVRNTGTGETPEKVYDNLYKKFDPVRFNAAEWVSIAEAAGMRYMVLTAKHHDGFCLWHSKVDSYNIGKSPFKRDICGELASAAHRAGMRIGWYFSPPDWHDPYCRTDSNEVYVRRMQTELTELLSDYGRIDILWFDTEGGPSPWDQKDTYRIVRSLQPGIVVNNRLDFDTDGVHNLATDVGPDADYATPEQRIGLFNSRVAWETCMTIGTQWSWKPHDHLKTPAECISALVECVSGDGNLLLDVGPMPDGRIAPRDVRILKSIGSWLRKYGESIFDTRGGPFRNGVWGGSTYRGDIVYLHILKWKGDSVILPAIKANIISWSALTGGHASLRETSDGIVISVPRGAQKSVDTIIKLKLNRPAKELGIIG